MKKTREVKIGKLAVGGKNPVRIKGMLKSSTDNFNSLIREASNLKALGAEAVRVAVKKESDARLVKKFKEKIDLPIVADIHFNHRLIR